MRWFFSFLLFLLALVQAQQSQVQFKYPKYLFLALNATAIAFDFTKDASNVNPPSTAVDPSGWLSKLDQQRYPKLHMAAASKDAWMDCLGGGPTQGQSYQGTARPPSPGSMVCRFAPTLITRQNFTATHHVNNPSCQNLRQDGTLLVFTNIKKRWHVQAHILNGSPPPGVSLYTLPLTLNEGSGVLCRYAPENERNVMSKHRKKIPSSGHVVISYSPYVRGRSKPKYAFASDHKAVFTIPLLYFLEIDPVSFNPTGQTTTVTVEYILGSP